MNDFKIHAEYYNKEHKITAYILNEDGKYFLMMVPKDQKIKYYEKPDEIENILKIKNFEKK